MLIITVGLICISTHDLTRRSTFLRYELIKNYIIFQLTTSQGGRQLYNFAIFAYNHFNSRPHKEVDRGWCYAGNGKFLFQLTTSQGGRPRLPRISRRKNYISTHDLTRRSTQKPVALIEYLIISTHDLTRRSTALVFSFITRYGYFNSRPHKEVDRKLLS